MSTDVSPDGVDPVAAPVERRLLLDGVDLASFLGHRDRLLSDLEAHHPGVSFHARDAVLTLRGAAPEVRRAEQVVLEVLELGRGLGTVSASDVAEAGRLVREGSGPAAARVLSEPIVSVRGTRVHPQTRGQRDYVDAIDRNTIVFGIGPAGTGKTYLAMAKAVQALQRREVARIILTRPAVEAGERLGHLPGTLEDKFDPYLRPLFDALGSMMEPDAVPRLIASGTIEVAPLAYMRGRTLNDSFVILDEAQNTTPEQMKMFLTRLGAGSKMVITGDITQLDLPLRSSGLRTVRQILRGVDDLHVAELGADDVVRHSLVARIVDAYAAHEDRGSAESGTERAEQR